MERQDGVQRASKGVGKQLQGSSRQVKSTLATSPSPDAHDTPPAEGAQACLLDEDGHRCWREILVTLGISNPDTWVRYAAKYATLPPLPAQLALAVFVWSIVSSTMLLCLQPALLAALAERMRCGGPLSPASTQRLQCTLRTLVQVHTRPSHRH